jgi:hypothetical protein
LAVAIESYGNLTGIPIGSDESLSHIAFYFNFCRYTEVVTHAYLNGVPQTGLELREGVKSHAIGLDQAQSARHVIDIHREPSFLHLMLKWPPMSWEATSVRPIARHVADPH